MNGKDVTVPCEFHLCTYIAILCLRQLCDKSQNQCSFTYFFIHNFQNLGLKNFNHFIMKMLKCMIKIKKVKKT